jgi:phage terminase Nu1 subunit (DNA packaging protein)
LNAKDKYIKIIVSDHDDAPLITLSTNEALRLSNEAKKEKLKEAKARLAEKQADIKRLAPLVEQGEFVSTLFIS